MDNQTIAHRLLTYARLLQTRDATLFRNRAYRQAADTVLRLDRPIATIVAEEGRAGLESLPGIGTHLAWTIERLVQTGQFRTYNGDELPREYCAGKHSIHNFQG